MPKSSSATTQARITNVSASSVTISAGTPTVLDVGMVPTSSSLVSYCTAGTSFSGCQSLLSSSGTPSASAASGFVVSAATVEGNKSGQFYYGISGRQANPWGNGSSFRCVAPPTWRAGILPANGTSGACDGSFAQDLTARWQAPSALPFGTLAPCTVPAR